MVDNLTMTEAYRAAEDGGPSACPIDPTLRRVLEAAEVAVATLDAEGRVLTATTAFARKWGRDVDDVIGLHLVGLWPERQRAEITATLVRLMEGASDVEILDTRSAGTDGALRITRLTFGRLDDHDGGVICAITDVTASHRGLRRRTDDHVEFIPSSPGARRPSDDRGDLELVLRRALRRANRSGSCISLLRCEISGLEQATSELGARVDELVGVHAERLANRLRPTDAVCRTSDHDFSVVAENLGDEQDAAGVAYRLLSSAVEPTVVEGREYTLGLTIGVVVGDAGSSVERMVTTAAAALDDARRDGVGGFRLLDIRSGLAA